VQDIPGLLTSIATLIGALALLTAAVRGFRRLEAKVGSVHLVAEQVNNSVNNVEQGHPTLRKIVESISEKLEHHITESSARLDRIEEHITRPTGSIPVIKSELSNESSTSRATRQSRKRKAD